MALKNVDGEVEKAHFRMKREEQEEKKPCSHQVVTYANSNFMQLNQYVEGLYKP